MRTEASLKTLITLPRFPSQHLNKTNCPCLPPLPACRIQIKASFSLRTLLISRLKILNVSVMCLFTSSRATSFGKSFFELREKDISDSFASFCESLFFEMQEETSQLSPTSRRRVRNAKSSRISQKLLCLHISRKLREVLCNSRYFDFSETTGDSPLKRSEGRSTQTRH